MLQKMITGLASRWERYELKIHKIPTINQDHFIFTTLHFRKNSGKDDSSTVNVRNISSWFNVSASTCALTNNFQVY